MADIARVLKAQLGKEAKKVPTRAIPDFMVRVAGLFDPAIRELTPGLGRKHVFLSTKAQRYLGWKPRPAATTIADCGKSLIAKGAVT